MADRTVRQIKDDVLTLISMLGGVDVQFYAEAKLTIMIRMKFESMFRLRFWERHCGLPFTVNLSLTTGSPTDDMRDNARVPTQDYQDIQWVMRPNEAKPLPVIPSFYNPNIVKRFGLSWTDDPLTLFRILPVGDATTLVRARRYTTDFNDDAAVVPFDSHCLIHGVCYDILNGLGTNPAEEDSHLGKYNQRLDQLTKAEDSQDHFGGTAGDPYYSDWQEVGY